MAASNNCYNLRYLGYSPISKFIPGLGVLQKPLHDLYVSYLTPKGPKAPMISRLTLTDRGIILTVKEKDSFYSMRDILLWEPVHWVYVQTKDKKIMSAFEPMNPDHHLSQEGLFSKLETQYKYLAQLKHEPVLAMALKRNSDAKQIEVHAFVCVSEAQAFEVARSLWRTEQVFMGQQGQGIGAANSPQSRIQETPKSVRVSSSSPSSSSGSSVLQVANGGGDVADKRGKQSARQAKGRKEEITLEELLLLADRALADPAGGGAGVGSRDPPFKMGEAGAGKERKGGVQRSRTFNDGPIVGRELGNGAVSRGAQEGRHQSPGPASRGAGGPNSSQPHSVPYYENVAASKSAQQRTYENIAKNSTPSPHGFPQPEVPGENHHQLPVPANERRPSAPVDLGRRSVVPESVRSAAANGKRPSVSPGSEFNIAGESNPPRQIVDVYMDDDEVPIPNPSKPVALVQPRKVPRFKVLPEASAEMIQLNKVPQNPGREEPRRDQNNQMGPGGNGRNITRSMYELNNIAPKPTTPLAQRKINNPEVDQARKMTNSDMNLARKSSNPELDPLRKNSIPESANRDGGGNRSGEKKKQEREKKDAEMEALALSANFERPPVNTISPHGTNFENALGYFP